MTALSAIEGIGDTYQGKLKEAGIRSVEALFEMCASAKGRKEVSAKTGISETFLLRWVNHADLFRIRGIGPEYAELLEVGGVDSVPELAQRNAENLFAKLNEVNVDKKKVRRLPVLSQVEDWIAQAKMLPKLVTH